MPTIGSTLKAGARRAADAQAPVFADGAYTCVELDAAVDQAASAPAELGPGKGDRPALMVPNCDRCVQVPRSSVGRGDA